MKMEYDTITYNKEYIYANKINELTKIETEITGKNN